MPNGFMPTYAYRPAVGGANPTLRGRSTRRARLFIGGTYFRARDPGGKGNNISIQLVEWTSSDGPHGKLVVTNHNTLFGENVTGPVEVEILEQALNWNERIQVDQLTTTPRAQIISISLQIAPGETVTGTLGGFAFSKLFTYGSKLATKVTPKQSEITPTSVIVFKPRVRVYDLASITVTPTSSDPSTPGVPVTGWDPAALREAINANDPWIEMMPRSGTPASSDPSTPALPPAVKFDAQDDGVDDPVMTAFGDTYLTGGDGLPDSPNTERSGPSRSIIYVNYGERYDGTLAETNEVYEWAGDSSTAGEWKKY